MMTFRDFGKIFLEMWGGLTAQADRGRLQPNDLMILADYVADEEGDEEAANVIRWMGENNIIPYVWVQHIYGNSASDKKMYAWSSDNGHFVKTTPNHPEQPWTLKQDIIDKMVDDPRQKTIVRSFLGIPVHISFETLKDAIMAYVKVHKESSGNTINTSNKSQYRYLFRIFDGDLLGWIRSLNHAAEWTDFENQADVRLVDYYLNRIASRLKNMKGTDKIPEEFKDNLRTLNNNLNHFRAIKDKDVLVDINFISNKLKRI